jgi:predicted TIM-barrel fold metal-dependent hydrolase
MLIDFHTHAFPDKVADKAIAWLMEYYGITISLGGRLGDLHQAAIDAKLDAYVLLMAATKPEQVRPANDWAIALAQRPAASGPRVIPFATYHPDDPNWRQEISRLRAAGIKGFKLHPEFQGVDLADPRLEEFFQEIQDDFVILTHIGAPHPAPGNHSTPAKVAAIHEKFPRLRLVAAHMGGYRFWDEAFEVLAGTGVYMDTSSVFPFLTMDQFRRLAEKHGPEHLLFGSDYPVTTPAHDLEIFHHIPWLTDTEKAMICGGNAARLLDI